MEAQAQAQTWTESEEPKESTTHHWKTCQTVNGRRFEFYTITDDRAVSADLDAHDTSFLRKDPCVARMRGPQSVEAFCHRRPLEAHVLLAEAAFEHHFATVHSLKQVCSAAEVVPFDPSDYELVNVVAPSDAALRIWRRPYK